jgi:hypothetical protein
MLERHIRIQLFSRERCGRDIPTTSVKSHISYPLYRRCGLFDILFVSASIVYDTETIATRLSSKGLAFSGIGPLSAYQICYLRIVTLYSSESIVVDEELSFVGRE